jgi:hypothetical protein
MRKDLHSWKLVSGRGRFRKDGRALSKASGSALYLWLLKSISFLQPESIITAVGHGSPTLYGHQRQQALLYGLFQRMQRASVVNQRLGLTFFDEGHGEYRKLYRQARVFLPTGSGKGAWEDGSHSKNLPMANFFKDGNFKNSKHSLFVQIADLVSYAAFLRVKKKHATLTDWQVAFGLGDAYAALPEAVLNKHASRKDPDKKGLIWL